MFRIGNGFDLHPLITGKHCVIGGVLVDSPHGFKAHSDGDILVHALCDAMLGAAGLGDIGTHFPDTNPAFKGAYSLDCFLPQVGKLVSDAGYQLVNLDATLILEEPHLAPYMPQIQHNLSETLQLATNCINIKATRTESCLFQKNQEAGMAWVSVLLTHKESSNQG